MPRDVRPKKGKNMKYHKTQEEESELLEDLIDFSLETFYMEHPSGRKVEAKKFMLN